MQYKLLSIKENQINDVLSCLNKKGSIDYKSNSKLNKGDIVYLYESSFYKNIVVIVSVVDPKIRRDKIIEHKEFDIVHLTDEEKEKDNFIRFELIEFIYGNFDKNFIKNTLNITSYSKNEWLNTNQVDLITKNILKHGKDMFEVFGKDAPNIYYLKPICRFCGTDGKEYFTTRARFSLDEQIATPYLCNGNRSLIPKQSQKKILKSKLKQLGFDLAKYPYLDNTDQMIIDIEKILGVDEKIVNNIGDNIVDVDEHNKNQELSLEELRLKAEKISAENKTKTNNVYKTLIRQYKRNQTIADYVIRKANGKCAGCSKTIGPDKKVNIPELQCHHIKPLSDGGLDTIENCEALCPNCHRHKHKFELKKE